MKFSQIKLFLSAGMAAALLSTGMALHAQATGTPPSGATGVCKDGTYAMSASKSGACRGHKGIKTWYATSAKHAAKSMPAAASATGKPATPPMAAKPSPSTVPMVPGGGPGMVWVNSSTKVYHCPGTRFYGKTKHGSYMSESEAKAKGFHADANKPCK
jgi:hypothetical protein